jgi:hypothetical protein
MNNFFLKCTAALLENVLGIANASALTIRNDLVVFYNAMNNSQEAVTLLAPDLSELRSVRDVVFDGAAPPAIQSDPAETTFYTINVASGSFIGTGAIPYVLALVARIKAGPGYTEAIGLDLDIVPPAPVPPSLTPPVITATPIANFQVEIRFVRGSYSGIEIQSSRQTTGAAPDSFTPLGIGLASPFVDTTPPLSPNTPDVVTYRARYLQGNNPVTDWSAQVVAVTIP